MLRIGARKESRARIHSVWAAFTMKKLADMKIVK